jgi:adenosylcobinamide-GDP ribazoletransferase
MSKGATPASADEAPAADGAGRPVAAAPRGLPAPLRGVRAAFLYFSRLPVGGYPFSSAAWHWAPAHLPLVGAVVGGACAGAFALGGWLRLPPLVAASITLALSLWLTGALHEDGLADAADGLGGAPHDRERALAIMKDSRIGSYGACALVLSLMLRAGAIAALAPGSWFALVYAHAWARVGPVWLLLAEPYVNERPDAKSQGLFATRPVHLATALGWGSLAALLGVWAGWLPWPAAVIGAMAPLASSAALGPYFQRRIGGVTGDLLGMAEQIAEAAAWVALSAVLG